MKKAIMILSLTLMMVGGLFAQDTQNVTMTVNLKDWYDLSFSTDSLTFNDEVPDFSATPADKEIAAVENAVTVRAFAVTKKSWTLTLKVSGLTDLTATVGTDTIGIGAIKWEATGDGFAGGQMALTDVTAGSWTGSVHHWHEGTFNYIFTRDYTSQAPGTYEATAHYVLSAI